MDEVRGNLRKVLGTLAMNQIEIVEPENIIFAIKNSLNHVNRSDNIEEKLLKLKEWSIKLPKLRDRKKRH